MKRKVRYATKNDVKRLENGMNLKFAFADDKFDNFQKEIKDLVLDSQLKIMTELKNIREEFAVHQFSHQRINEEIEELQADVKNLKSSRVA